MLEYMCQKRKAIRRHIRQNIGISVSLKTPTSVAQIKCMTKNKHTTNS